MKTNYCRENKTRENVVFKVWREIQFYIFLDIQFSVYIRICLLFDH